VSAAAKDAELYLRRCRRLEGVIADLLAALGYAVSGDAGHVSGDFVEQASAAMAKARAAL